MIFEGLQWGRICKNGQYSNESYNMQDLPNRYNYNLIGQLDLRWGLQGIFLRGMFYIMAQEKTSASKVAQVFEFQSPCVGTVGNGKYYGSVKIDEITIIRGIALAKTDTVGIMTC